MLPTRAFLGAVAVFWPCDTTVRADDKPLVSSLVRAKVTAVGEKDKGGEVAAQLTVVHVYSGPAELVGQTFTGYQFSGPQISGPAARPRAPFVKGDEELWSVGPDRQDRTKLAGGVVSRKADNRRHEQAVAVAEAMEKVEQAKPADRVGVLKKFGSDPTPEVCEWAVTTLGKSKEAAAGEYLDALAEKPDAKWPLAAQAALDAALCERKGADWHGSKPRAELLRGWVAGKITEYDADTVLRRLNAAHRHEEMSDKLAVELFRTAAENKDWPWAVRRRAIFDVGRAAMYCANDEAITSAFDWVFEKVRKGDDVEVRRAAAHTLRGFFTLLPARLTAVEEHLATEKDTEVADALRAAVKKAKEDK